MTLRRFVLVRHVDVSGVSGTGVVIWGVRWPDGRCAYRWNTSTATTVVADAVEDVLAVHAHDGATELVWVDSDREADRWQRYVRLDDGKPAPVWRGGAADGGMSGRAVRAAASGSPSSDGAGG